MPDTPTPRLSEEADTFRPLTDERTAFIAEGEWYRGGAAPARGPTAVEIMRLAEQAQRSAAEMLALRERVRELAGLRSLVDDVAQRYDDEGTLRLGEVAIYRTSTGYAVQVRRRNGSSVECGRHSDFHAALAAAAPPAPEGGEG